MYKVHKIGISKLKGKEIEDVIEVKAIAGEGLENDRFCKNNNHKTSQITLIEKEIIDDFNSLLNLKIPYKNFRRNIITEGIRLNELVGKKFNIGKVKVKAHDLCRPCKSLQDNLGQENIIKEFLQKGGLRCEILTGGKIFVGDNIKV